MRNPLRTLVLLGVGLSSPGIYAQLLVDGTMTPTELVQNVLLGGGVTVSNITFNGVAAGPISEQAGSFTAPAGSNLGLEAGLILSSGLVVSDPDNFNFGANGDVDDFASNQMGGGSDADLELLSGQTINDAAILEFDFVPTGDSLQFRYVFGSEEYPSFTCSNYNDAFGFFLSGPGIAGPFSGGAVNIALIPGTTIPVSINTLNSGEASNPGDEPDCAAFDPNWQSNSIYYVDNASQAGTIVTYDGFTTVLTAFALVQCGQQYHIKLAIGDGFDESYDSGVFLEAGSFSSTGQVIPSLTPGPGIVGTTINEGCVPVELTFTRQGDLSLAETVTIVVSGTATPGVDYSPALPTQLDFAAEDSTVTFVLDVPLDADGPETMIITINQLVVCASTNVETTFNFDIVSPEPLWAEGEDINATCGDVNVLAPAIFGGVGEYEFLWSTGETTPTITVSPEVTTAYDFTVTDGCNVEPFFGTLFVYLPVYDPLAIEVSPATSIPCLGSDQISVVNATGGNGQYTYSWTLNGAPAGNGATITVPSVDEAWYNVVVTEGCGSAVEDSVLVTMTPLDPIVITTEGDVTVICREDTATLVISDIAGGNGVYTITWTDQDAQVMSMGYDLEVGVPNDALYTITVEDQCGTVGGTELWTRIPHYPPFGITTTPDHLICLGDSTTVAVEVQGGSGYYTIEWPLHEFTDPVMAVVPEETSSYLVLVTDRCGAVQAGLVRVEVEAPYTFITTENLGQDDWHVRASTVPPARNHVWDMGDGSRYRQEHVYHSYLDLEDHWVTLRITTESGCTAEDSVLLQAPAHLYFPNAFTPDGDGRNDFFGPVGNAIESFEMTVFDRWGEQIYYTDKVDVPWNGEVNGSGVGTSGVYVYKYRATGRYFPSTEGIGHVTLLKGTQD
ncbi:MAG TPA: choice-of-anchor L domain-containing protein [Flavobacteriales bacterium]|nr:choice-of-anchor L domain-containing protein [Flavobacteriales bacterium]